MKEAAHRITETTAATGITTEQAIAAAGELAEILRLMTYQPGQLETEIACIKTNPSLRWWQKISIIRGLKKQIEERERIKP